MDRRTEKRIDDQVTDCEELSPMEQEYNLMKKHHTYSRVLAPIFSRDHLSGFIGMDHFYKGISELFIHQLAFVGAHLNTARENLRMFTLLGKNLESMEKERQILNVLCEDCASVYKVNLLDDTAEVVKLEQGANAYLEDVQKCKEAGMNDHMSKPVQIEQIIRTVERWMK